MYITVNSVTVHNATDNKDSGEIIISGLNLDEILAADNIRPDYEPTTYSYLFHTTKSELSYLWKALRKMQGISLMDKLDSCVGKEIYINTSFLLKA